jgi:hypothetical protein
MMPETIHHLGIAAQGVPTMDLLTVTTLIVSALTVLGLAAERWGADTRPSLPDDHRR